MKQFQYVILDQYGKSWVPVRNEAEYQEQQSKSAENYILPRLLADGWRPVRESPLGQFQRQGWFTGYSLGYSLLVLERDG